MITDDLIARLTVEPPKPALRPALMALVIGAAIVGPVALFLGVLGVRPDLALAWFNPVVPFKTLLPLLTCSLSALLLLRLSRPEARLGLAPAAYLVPGLAALALWIGAFLLRQPAERFAEDGVKSLAECLGGILLLSIVPALVALRVLRQGASTNPALSAALAGFTAASGAATGYSLFCTRDNPLFFVTWYGAAILIGTLITAWAGRRVLSW